MSESHASGRNGRLAVTAAVLIAAPLLYLLSSAPVLRLCNREEPIWSLYGEQRPPRAWEVVYAPIYRLAEWRPTRPVVMRWFAVWGKELDLDKGLTIRRWVGELE